MNDFITEKFSVDPLSLEKVKEFLLEPDELFKPKIEDNIEKFEQLILQVQGIPEDKNTYINLIYDLGHSNNFLLLEEPLEKSIENQNFQNLQKIYSLWQENPRLSMNRMVAFMQGFNLLPKTKYSESWLIHCYLQWLEKLNEKRSQVGKVKIDHQFQRIFTDCVKWSFTYLQDELMKERSKWRILFWYKTTPLTDSHIWFIELAQILGFNLLYIDITQEYLSPEMPSLNLPLRSDLLPFPTEKKAIVSTVAKEASVEFEGLMNQESSLFFKPFQYKNAKIQTVRLQTTYDELKIIGNSEAYLRPAFRAMPQEVTLPVLFCKVNGVLDNEGEYWAQIQSLKGSLENVQFIQEFPICKARVGSSENRILSRDYAMHGSFMASEDFVPEALVSQPDWRYNKLPRGTQLALAERIISFCISLPIRLKYKEKEEVLQAHIYEVLLHLPKAWVELFQTTDYPRAVPKILVFVDSAEDELIREDAILLSFMSSIGFDIVIYNPLGQNDIENYIDEENIDIHWLDQLKSVNQEEMNTHLTKKKIKFLNFI